MSSAKSIENTHIIHAFPYMTSAGKNPTNVRCDDMFNGNPRGDIISLSGAQRIIFLIINNKVTDLAGWGGTAVITIEGCKGTTAKANQTCPLSFRVRVITTPDTVTVPSAPMVTYTTLGLTDTIYELECDACQLPCCTTDVDGPWEYVRMKVEELSVGATDQPVHGAYVAILDGLRNAEDLLTPQSV